MASERATECTNSTSSTKDDDAGAAQVNQPVDAKPRKPVIVVPFRMRMDEAPMGISLNEGQTDTIPAPMSWNTAPATHPATTYLQKLHPNDSIVYMGANLSGQTVRTASMYANATAHVVFHDDYVVPMMLHASGAFVFEARTQTKLLWHTRVLYDTTDLPAVDEKTLDDPIPINEKTKAQWTQAWQRVGDELSILVADEDEPSNLVVLLTVQKVLATDTGRALLFFGGQRVWSVKKSALFMPLSKLQTLASAAAE